MKRVLIPGVILCGADVAQAVDDKNMYMGEPQNSEKIVR